MTVCTICHAVAWAPLLWNLDHHLIFRSRNRFFNRPPRSCGKVMFYTCLWFCSHTRGGSLSRAGGGVSIHGGGLCPGRGWGLYPGGSLYGYVRAVRIQLEWILVSWRKMHVQTHVMWKTFVWTCTFYKKTLLEQFDILIPQARNFFLDPPLIEHTKKRNRRTKIGMCNIQRPLAAVYLFHWFRFRFAVCSIKGEITKHYGWVGLTAAKPLVYGHTSKRPHITYIRSRFKEFGYNELPLTTNTFLSKAFHLYYRGKQNSVWNHPMISFARATSRRVLKVSGPSGPVTDKFRRPRSNSINHIINYFYCVFLRKNWFIMFF